MSTGDTKKGISSSKFEYGNILIIFAQGLNNDHTLVHEAAHTFSLEHTYSLVKENKYVFYYGYTENYMDYHFHHTFNNLVDKKLIYTTSEGKTLIHQKDNRYRGKMYSFYKWQWDQMREDRSIEKK